MECSVPGCQNKARDRGWCPKHYMRWRAHGDPAYPSVQDLTPEERFWQKVDKAGDCWIWTSAVFSDGYGAFFMPGKQWRAHRFSYFLHYGEIPPGLVVMHSCDTPLCVNPEHLSLGTPGQNAADSARKGRRPRGQENSQSKLTEAEVLDMRARYAQGGITQKELAQSFGVSHALVSFIVTRKAWRHI